MNHLSGILRRTTNVNFILKQQVRNGTTIRVLLLANVNNRGLSGEVVKVKRGYFRNFLYPRKLAAYNTPENLEKYKYVILERERQKAAEKAAAEAAANPPPEVPLIQEAENAVMN